jgi:hypothetical protein
VVVGRGVVVLMEVVVVGRAVVEISIIKYFFNQKYLI